MKVKVTGYGVLRDFNNIEYIMKDINGCTLYECQETGELFTVSEFATHNMPFKIESCGKYTREFIDIETNEKVYEFELVSIFAMLKLEDPETYNYSFYEFLKNCTSWENGTLDEI